MKIIFHCIFLCITINGFCQPSFNVDTINTLSLINKFNTIAIGEYIHGSKNINNKKFEIASEIISKGNHYKVAIEAGMDESVIFNRNNNNIDSTLTFFYPIYRDKSTKNFLLSLREANHNLFGFDCQNFIPEVFLPEFSDQFEDIARNDSVINKLVNSSKVEFYKSSDLIRIQQTVYFYETLLTNLDQKPFNSDLKKQLKVCILNRICVSKALMNREYFWEIRDSLMYECFQNLKEAFNKENQKFVLLGASGHLSSCYIYQNWGRIKPFGMFLDKKNTYFIHISGYKGKVINIMQKQVAVNFLTNIYYRSLKEKYPQGFSKILSYEDDLSRYLIPFYKGVMNSNCGNLYINLGEITPSEMLWME